MTTFDEFRLARQIVSEIYSELQKMGITDFLTGRNRIVRDHIEFTNRLIDIAKTQVREVESFVLGEAYGKERKDAP